MSKEIKIAVAGTGYVGLSIATLLAQHHPVMAVDVVPEKVEQLNRRQSPIQDEYIEKYLAEKELRLTATLDGASAYRDADFIVIAAPTNYDPVRNYFDTHHIEDVIDLVLSVNPHAVMVIKSTIPVGYCRSLYLKYVNKGIESFNLLFSPEFLRESKALYDNLYPSRIIVGYPKLIGRRAVQGRERGHPSHRRYFGLRRGCAYLCRLVAGGGHQAGHPHPVHGHERGGGGEAVRQYLSGFACQLFQ